MSCSPRLGSNVLAVFVFVVQVGPGVKELSEGDVVLPTVPLLGTFTQAAVKAKQLVSVGKLASLDTDAAAATKQSQGARMDP